MFEESKHPPKPPLSTGGDDDCAEGCANRKTPSRPPRRGRRRAARRKREGDAAVPYSALHGRTIGGSTASSHSKKVEDGFLASSWKLTDGCFFSSRHAVGPGWFTLDGCMRNPRTLTLSRTIEVILNDERERAVGLAIRPESGHEILWRRLWVDTPRHAACFSKGPRGLSRRALSHRISSRRMRRTPTGRRPRTTAFASVPSECDTRAQ